MVKACLSRALALQGTDPYPAAEPFDLPFARFGLGRAAEARGQFISALRLYARGQAAGWGVGLP